MTALLAGSICAALFVAAVFHALWALRIWVPWRDEQVLAQHVVGPRGIERMPGAGVTWLVVAVLGLCLLLLAHNVGWIALPLSDGFLRLALLGLATIFLLRGVITYTPLLRGVALEPAFASLNRWVYSPLLVALGAGMVWVAL